MRGGERRRLTIPFSRSDATLVTRPSTDTLRELVRMPCPISTTWQAADLQFCSRPKPLGDAAVQEA